MGMADDNRHEMTTARFDTRSLAQITRGDVVSVSVDEVEDAFGEWDESTPMARIAQGSQPHALPTSSRTTTLSDPLTTRRLAEATRPPVARALEEALLALTNGVPEPLP